MLLKIKWNGLIGQEISSKETDTRYWKDGKIKTGQ
jgi:hypothetical protein